MLIISVKGKHDNYYYCVRWCDIVIAINCREMATNDKVTVLPELASSSQVYSQFSNAGFEKHGRGLYTKAHDILPS